MTPQQAAKLRGMISRYVETAKQVTRDASVINRNLNAKAHSEVYGYVAKLEKEGAKCLSSE